MSNEIFGQFYSSDGYAYETDKDLTLNYCDKHENLNLNQIESNNGKLTYYFEECAEKASGINAQFFIINDLVLNNNNNLNNSKYNCYIPDITNSDLNTGQYSSATEFEKYEGIKKKIFGENYNEIANTNRTSIGTSLIDLSSNGTIEGGVSFYSIPSSDELNRLNLTKDKYREIYKKHSYFTNEGSNYIIYNNINVPDTKELTDLVNKLNQIKSNLKTPQYSIEDLNRRFEEYKKKYILLSGELFAKYKNFICYPSDDNLNSFNELTERSNNEFRDFDNLQTNLTNDINNLTKLKQHKTKNNSYYESLILGMKNNLDNLLQFDGANNEKLYDTNRLKNLKIAEINIIIIVLIFAIFYYTKN